MFTILLFLCPPLFSAPLYSPTWGFSLDLPEGFEYVEGDGRDRFSFEHPDGAYFDIVVYHGEADSPAPYPSLEALMSDVYERLNNEISLVQVFNYRDKLTWVMELSFSVPGHGARSQHMSGWALCLELPRPEGTAPMLLALAYGPGEKEDLLAYHFSALDSIAPELGDILAPGPITEIIYPRETRVRVPLFDMDIEAWIFDKDAEAAQDLIDREFILLRRYLDSPDWRQAWSRFYRAIYRDSYERLADIAFQVERKLNVPPRETRDFAEQLLRWVQSFTYERDLLGSDFLNLVSAAVEGRGDCDNRAMLWAMILNHSNIPAGIMVSRHYGHAMGLADLPGEGARLEVNGQRLLVAETTANVDIGLIEESVSDIEYWLGILFE